MIPHIRGLFPQTRHALETGALLAHTRVPPDPAAPLCEEVGDPREGWVLETVPAEVMEGKVSLWLPPDFENASTRGGDPRFWGRREGDRVVLGVSLVSWPGEPSHMTVGTGPEATQSGVAECRLPRADHTLHLLAFVLHEGEHLAPRSTYWMSAVLIVNDGRWLMGAGSAPDPAGQAELRAILQTLRPV